jgi:hypothetical protein
MQRDAPGSAAPRSVLRPRPPLGNASAAETPAVVRRPFSAADEPGSSYAAGTQRKRLRLGDLPSYNDPENVPPPPEPAAGGGGEHGGDGATPAPASTSRGGGQRDDLMDYMASRGARSLPPRAPPPPLRLPPRAFPRPPFLRLSPARPPLLLLPLLPSTLLQSKPRKTASQAGASGSWRTKWRA